MINYLKIHLVAKNPLILYNVKNTCLINLEIISYYASSLNIYEYLKYHQHQYYHNQLKSHRHIHIIQSFSHDQLKSLLKQYPNTMESFALNL